MFVARATAFDIRKKIKGIRTVGTGTPNAQHIEELTSHWNSPIFVL